MSDRPIIFGLGLPKTGTVSLHSAVRRLGWDSLHSVETLSLPGKNNPDFWPFPEWIEKGRNAFWDFPVMRFCARLLKEYPDAKYIVSRREVMDWIKSRDWHVGPGTHAGWQINRKKLRQEHLRWSNTIPRLLTEANTNWLDFDLFDGDGWSKLATFLGVNAPPKTKFPHYNKQPKFQFTHDWVTAHTEVWGTLFESWNTQPKHALEIGSWEGCSACWMLLNVLCHPDSTITCIDPWYNREHEARFLHNIALTGQANQVCRIRAPSWDVLHHIQDNSLDAAYVDGSHEGRDALCDGLMVWRKLKLGGILVFDDYGWQNPGGARHYTPKPAIDAWLQLNDWSCELIHKGYQVAVKKIKDR